MKNTRMTKRIALAAALLAGTATAAVTPSGVASAKATSPTTTYYTVGTATTIRGLSISGYDNKTVLASISTSAGTLKLGTTTGLTLAYGYSKFEGADLIFTGTQSAINTALGTLTLTVTSSASTNAVLKTMFAESVSGVAYYPTNQHFYKYVKYPAVQAQGVRIAALDNVRNNDVAQAVAKASSMFGLSGYLANISSQAENDFVSAKLEGATNVWIGGSDAAEETKWIYTEGPDKGTNFWNGCASTETTRPGSSPAGQFAQWSPDGEPNNYITGTNKCGGTAYDPAAAAGEDCIVTNWSYGDPKYVTGYWNDVPCDLSTSAYTYPKVSGYVIEYGNSATSATFDTTVDTGTFSLYSVSPAQKPQAVKAKAKVDVGSLISKSISSWKTAIQGKAQLLKEKKANDAVLNATRSIKFKCPAMKRYKVETTFKFANRAALAANDGRFSFYVTDTATNKLIPMGCGSVIGKMLISTGKEYSVPVVRDLNQVGDIVGLVLYLVPEYKGGSSVNLNVIIQEKQADGSYKLYRLPGGPGVVGTIKP